MNNILTLTQQVKELNIKEALDKKYCDLVFSLLGKDVKVKLADNKQEKLGEGLFYTMNPSQGGVILKNYRPEGAGAGAAPGEANKDTTNNVTKCLNRSDFVFIFAENVEDPPLISDYLSLKNKQNFRTDVEIGDKDVQAKNRTLQAVDFIFGRESCEGESLGSSTGLQPSVKKFDQFEENQSRFGVGTDFKDEYYTTKLDYSKLDKDQIANAERLENQVIKEASTNKHVLIDRGHNDLLAQDSDEEKDYSAVHGSGRYNIEGNVIRRVQKPVEIETPKPSSKIPFGKGKPSFTSKDKKETLTPAPTAPSNDADSFPTLSVVEPKPKAPETKTVATEIVEKPQVNESKDTSVQKPSPVATSTASTSQKTPDVTQSQETSIPKQEPKASIVEKPPASSAVSATATAAVENTTTKPPATSTTTVETSVPQETKPSTDPSTAPKKKLQLRSKQTFVEKVDTSTTATTTTTTTASSTAVSEAEKQLRLGHPPTLVPGMGQPIQMVPTSYLAPEVPEQMAFQANMQYYQQYPQQGYPYQQYIQMPIMMYPQGHQMYNNGYNPNNQGNPQQAGGQAKKMKRKEETFNANQ